MATERKEIKQPKPLPAPNVDFYELSETLPAEEREVVKQVREFMQSRVAPIITKYWVDDAFPFELLPAIKELNIGGAGMEGYGCRGGEGRLFWLGGNGRGGVEPPGATVLRGPQWRGVGCPSPWRIVETKT